MTDVRIGDRVRILPHAPLRGAHECERVGVVRGVGEGFGPGDPWVICALEPAGRTGGPFYPGEYARVGGR